MLNIEKIGIEFAGNWLLKDASYQFQAGEIVGLIGRNGAGKSSLLRIIAGKATSTEGNVHLIKDAKIGYYHQDLLSYETEKSIFDVAKEAFKSLLEKKEEIDRILTELENGSEDWDLWDKLAHLQVEYEALGGDRMEASTYEILAGLGFKPTEFHQPYKEFSGGWRMRVMLAKMLLEQPQVLLLDEPTNHLDLPSIQWIENYLRTYAGVCIIVSHDRQFLDRMVDKVVEISLQKLNVYSGNYSFYIEAKAERMELLQRAFDNQQKYIADQQRFIDRFKAKASKAKQAQSKMKQLDKVERVDAPEEEDFDLNIRFKVRTPSGREVISLRNISKAYGPKVILRNSEATIERGDKIALIGANGLGKSTLLRIVADIESFEGTRKEGHNVVTGFFAQHQLEALNLTNTILQELSQMGSDKTDMELRSVLGCFMFSGDDVTKKIQVLSGGEKSRVALAKVLISEANFLLLDEPTNHLDIPSIQILIQALQSYEGTYITISHDRHFLSQVANKIWYIEDQTLKEYPGDYEEYDHFMKLKEENTEKERKETLQAQKQEKKALKEERVAPTKVEVIPKPQDFGGNKQRKNQIRKLEKEQEDLERIIADSEKKKAALTLKMAEPAVAANYGKLQEVQNDIAKMDTHLAHLTEKWESVVLELEGLVSAN